MLRKLIKKAKKSKRGFTLIELIVVIAILAILAAVIAPNLLAQIGKAQYSTANSDAQAVYMAATLYHTEMVSNNDSTDDIAANSEYSSISNATIVKMFNDPYFNSIPISRFTAIDIKTDANDNITSVSVTEASNGQKPGNYPIVSTT
jgi:type II secretion system protein G